MRRRLSFVLALSAPGVDYDGGGTRFAASEGSRGGDVVVRRPARGAALIFEGGTVWHGASDVTRGVRYVLSGFVGVTMLSAEKQLKMDRLLILYKP